MTREQSIFFEEFYQEHFNKLVGYAYRFLHNWEDAKVATQEAFLVGVEKIDTFEGSESQLAWIKNVIKKKASNMNRTRALRETVVVPLETLTTPPGACDSHEREDVEALLDHCAALLKPEEYALFIEAIWKRKPYPQLSREWGITEHACRKRVQRAIRKLNDNWDKENL